MGRRLDRPAQATRKRIRGGARRTAPGEDRNMRRKTTKPAKRKSVAAAAKKAAPKIRRAARQRSDAVIHQYILNGEDFPGY